MLLQIISHLKMNSSGVASEHNRTNFPRGIMFPLGYTTWGYILQNTQSIVNCRRNILDWVGN